ncbi:unnamed protein product [Microthlaspi erraticum]|uniref:Uncharacterized protein n=1 Tax=Microthlaspi erraticum TaxID=1685480 RepID=A0A6D2JME8_9BRAS|nr:unnamed protein product [Microthlaspi erraticum]
MISHQVDRGRENSRSVVGFGRADYLVECSGRTRDDAFLVGRCDRARDTDRVDCRDERGDVFLFARRGRALDSMDVKVLRELIVGREFLGRPVCGVLSADARFKPSGPVFRSGGSPRVSEVSGGIVVEAMYGFSLCPLTVKSPPIGSHSTTAPKGRTSLILNGPDHLERSFPGKSFSLELNNNTWSFGAKLFGMILRSWKALFSPYRSLNSHMPDANLIKLISWINLLSPAVFRLKFNSLIAQAALYSSSTGK